MDDRQAKIVSLAQRVLGSDIADLPAGERGVVLEVPALHQIDRMSAVLDQLAGADGAAPGAGG